MQPLVLKPQRPDRARPRGGAVIAITALVSSTFVGLAAPAHGVGATYFVNNTVTCSDTTADSTTTPFCTISAAEKKTAPGDTVSVAGGTYNEQVNADVAGVTFKATGPAVLEGKTPAVFNNGFVVRAVDGITIQGFTIQNQAVHGIIIDASATTAPFTPATNITVRGVTVLNAGNHGINVQNSNHVLISGTAVKNSGRIGIRLAGTSDSTVRDGSSTGNVFHGISVQSTAASVGSNNTITGMVSSFNKNPTTRESTGINVSDGAAGTDLERNTTYSNDDSGIQVYSRATGTLVRRNVTYDNGDHGIDLNAAAGTTVVSNTSVGNFTVGINAENSSTGVTLRDNLSVDDGANSDRTKGNYRVDATSQSGTTMERDLAYQSASSTNLWYWGSTGYATLGAFQAASGQEAHGFQADPRFVSLAGRNLRPGAGSPVIDAGYSDVPGWTSNDRFGNAPVDDPSVPNTGTGPVTFADVGAIERTDVGTPPPPVDNPPVAKLTANPTAPVEGGSTTLDASASTDDNGIAGYTFDCKNATALITGTAATARCTYPTAGTYKPTVTVKDTAGQTSTAQVTITVSAAPTPTPPTAALTVSRTSLRQGQHLTVDASGSQGTGRATIASFAFKCGRQPWRPAQPTATTECVFMRVGEKTIRVQVVDSNGLSSTATALVTVTPGVPPTARLAVSDRTPSSGQRIRLDASASTGTALLPIRAYRFKCGSQATTAWRTSPTKACTFRALGWHRVRVWVTSAPGLWDVRVKQVHVHRR